MIQIGAPSATLDSPLEHLTACHRRIEQRLDTLVKAADHFATDRGQALAAIARSIEFMDSNGVLHTRDEEESLFPRLRPKLTPDETAFVDQLESQHQEAETIFAELKQIVDQRVPDNRIENYRDCAHRLNSLYRAHIQVEDEILAALARRSLSAADLQQISHEMRSRREAQ